MPSLTPIAPGSLTLGGINGFVYLYPGDAAFPSMPTYPGPGGIGLLLITPNSTSARTLTGGTSNSLTIASASASTLTLTPA